MKRWFFGFCALAMILGYSACERHDWSETRRLYDKQHASKGHAADSKAPAKAH